MVAIASGNPLDLIVSGGVKLYGEESGRSTIEGRAKQTVTGRTDRLKLRYDQQGWIE